jgi:glycerophosphoryl diester phosphodiesterase
MKTQIYGHRGSKGNYPENTILGFEKAIEAGVTGMEIDIHMTKDHQIVVFHDPTLERTSTGTGYIKDLTLDEVRKFSVGAKFKGFEKYEESWDKEIIPTLTETLELFKKFDLEVNIELKTYEVPYPGIEERMFEVVKESGYDPDKIIYSSFHIPTLLRIRQVNPLAKIGFLTVQDLPRMIDYFDTMGLEAFHPGKDQVLANPDLWRPLADKVRVWTVNDSNDIETFIKMGVNAIITDYPEIAVPLLSR